MNPDFINTKGSSYYFSLAIMYAPSKQLGKVVFTLASDKLAAFQSLEISDLCQPTGLGAIADNYVAFETQAQKWACGIIGQEYDPSQELPYEAAKLADARIMVRYLDLMGQMATCRKSGTLDLEGLGSGEATTIENMLAKYQASQQGILRQE